MTPDSIRVRETYVRISGLWWGRAEHRAAVSDGVFILKLLRDFDTRILQFVGYKRSNGQDDLWNSSGEFFTMRVVYRSALVLGLVVINP